MKILLAENHAEFLVLTPVPRGAKMLTGLRGSALAEGVAVRRGTAMDISFTQSFLNSNPGEYWASQHLLALQLI